MNIICLLKNKIEKIRTKIDKNYAKQKYDEEVKNIQNDVLFQAYIHNYFHQKEEAWGKLSQNEDILFKMLDKAIKGDE